MHEFVRIIVGLPLLAVFIVVMYFAARLLRVIGRRVILRLFKDEYMASDPVMSVMFGILPFALLAVIAMMAQLFGSLVLGW